MVCDCDKLKAEKKDNHQLINDMNQERKEIYAELTAMRQLTREIYMEQRKVRMRNSEVSQILRSRELNWADQKSAL